MRAKILEILEIDGHKVLEAGDGLSGLPLASACGPDCVTPDLIMPEVNGLKIFKTLTIRITVRLCFIPNQ